MMRWVMLSFLLLGAGLYAAGAFTSSRSALVVSTPTSSAVEANTVPAKIPFAPVNGQGQSPGGTLLKIHPPTAVTSVEAPLHLSNNVNAHLSDVTADPSTDPVQRPWGQLLRNAPVHSGPSVSSAVLGYAALGTEMQILKHELGWVQVLDPETSRQGWIYEKHVIGTESPDTGNRRAVLAQAALTNDESGASEPTTSLKKQRPRKNYASKKSRRNYVNDRRRTVLGFFRLRRF